MGRRSRRGLPDGLRLISTYEHPRRPGVYSRVYFLATTGQYAVVLDSVGLVATFSGIGAAREARDSARLALAIEGIGL